MNGLPETARLLALEKIHERPLQELRCPAGAILDTWSKHEWSEGLQVDHLQDLDSLVIQTQNSTYEITIVCGRTGEVLVRGGQFFPQVTRARLAGSSLGGSFLKMLGIYVGFRMEIHANQQSIVTSRVQSIRCVPETARVA